jgi:hypothetical protein
MGLASSVRRAEVITGDRWEGIKERRVVVCEDGHNVERGEGREEIWETGLRRMGGFTFEDMFLGFGGA